jgi:hypothetical protein
MEMVFIHKIHRKNISKYIFLAVALSQYCRENNIIQSLKDKNSSGYDEAYSMIIADHQTCITYIIIRQLLVPE